MYRGADYYPHSEEEASQQSYQSSKDASCMSSMMANDLFQAQMAHQQKIVDDVYNNMHDIMTPQEVKEWMEEHCSTTDIFNEGVFQSFMLRDDCMRRVLEKNWETIIFFPEEFDDSLTLELRLLVVLKSRSEVFEYIATYATSDDNDYLHDLFPNPPGEEEFTTLIQGGKTIFNHPEVTLDDTFHFVRNYINIMLSSEILFYHLVKSTVES